MGRKKGIRLAVMVMALGAGLMIGPGSAMSQPKEYDRFGPVYKIQPTTPSAAKNAALHFLLLPFEILRWPVDQGLYYMEKHHLDKKFRWVLEKLESHGIIPYFNFISLGSFGAGGDFDILRMMNAKNIAPDLITKTKLRWTNNTIFEVGQKVGVERLGGTGFGVKGIFNYSDRPEEHFHGIGPDTSRGEGVNFRMETTKIGISTGYSLNPSFEMDFELAWRNINIAEGEDDGRGQLSHFAAGSIPGSESDDLLDFQFTIKHDNRDKKQNSTRGGYQKAGFGYHYGVGGSDAGYFRYHADVAHFLSLGSKRRVLAIRFYGEHNDEVNNHIIPFHQMAKLGGYGAYPRLSETLRGFDFNRFFDESMLLMNLEYRYTIWEYREMKTDAIIFWDEGQVFGEISDFQFKDFRESYGVGMRVSLANHVLLSLEVAHGDEGTNLYVKSRTPF